MAMTTPAVAIETASDRETRKVWQDPAAWLLVLPLCFLAASGQFVFQDPSAAMGASSLTLLIHERNIGITGYALDGMTYLIMAGCILFRYKSVLRLAASTRLVSCLALLALLSIAWSQNPMRSASNGMTYLVDTLFAFYLVARFDSEYLEKIIMLAGSAMFCLCLAMVILDPKLGITQGVREAGSWRGLFVDRTATAKCFIFLLSPAIRFGRHAFTRRRLIYGLCLTLFIAEAHAATALVVLLIFVFGMFVLSAMRRLDGPTALFVGACLTVFIPTIAFLGVTFSDTILRALGRDPTLTGRTVIWSALLVSIAKHPLLGYGYYAFWQGLTGESANVIISIHWFFGYAHNGWLEILLQLGLVGGLLVLLTLLQALHNAWICSRSPSSGKADWYIGLIILTILYNVDESTILWPHALVSVLYIVACCRLAQMAREVRYERAQSSLPASGPGSM